MNEYAQHKSRKLVIQLRACALIQPCSKIIELNIRRSIFTHTKVVFSFPKKK